MHASILSGPTKHDAWTSGTSGEVCIPDVFTNSEFKNNLSTSRRKSRTIKFAPFAEVVVPGLEKIENDHHNDQNNNTEDCCKLTDSLTKSPGSPTSSSTVNCSSPENYNKERRGTFTTYRNPFEINPFFDHKTSYEPRTRSAEGVDRTGDQRKEKIIVQRNAEQEKMPTLQRENVLNLQNNEISNLQQERIPISQSNNCPRLPPLNNTESKTRRGKTEEYLGSPGEVRYILEDPKRCIEEAILRRRGVCPTNPHLGNKIKSAKQIK